MENEDGDGDSPLTLQPLTQVPGAAKSLISFSTLYKQQTNIMLNPHCLEEKHPWAPRKHVKTQYRLVLY